MSLSDFGGEAAIGSRDAIVAGEGLIWYDEDPRIQGDAPAMKLRLTYEGPLLGANSNNPRAKHKHDLRMCFHAQLKRFWDLHPALKKVFLQDANDPRTHYAIVPYLAERFERNGYNFVPLVSGFFGLDCSIHVLMLRHDAPGAIVKSGDLDNRLKTIFDALRMPHDKPEFGNYRPPNEDEKPFYVLLEDDNLITHVSIEADTLLEPVSALPNPNDARLIIRVEIKPFILGSANSVFA